jgi:hypothetical protein
MVKKNQNDGPKEKNSKVKDLKLRKDTVKTLTDPAATNIRGGASKGQCTSWRTDCQTK